jgi:hypothetical protein
LAKLSPMKAPLEARLDHLDERVMDHPAPR